MLGRVAAEQAEDATTSGAGGDSERSGERAAAPVPCLTLLYHPLAGRIGERAALASVASGAAVRLSRLEPRFAHPGEKEGTPLGDSHVSRSPSRLLALGDGRIRLELGENRSRVVVSGEPLAGTRDFAVDEVRRGVVVEMGDRVVLLLHYKNPSALRARARPSSVTHAGDPLGMVGHSYFVERVRRDVRRVADLDVPVLLRGETGTGKELVARAIHGASERWERPFVAVNLGAIPPSLASAELFGAERGAFTGADRRRPGYFNLADKGTLFLDEVGEAPAEIQAGLLRALEAGEIQSVGASHPHRVDVRIIAATDADLEAKIAQGTFRAPLLHRLASYEIVLPPLRARRDDIGRLLVHFLREELARIGDPQRLDAPAQGAKPWLPPSLMVRLAMYDWPGNVRQLRNVVRQLVVGSRGAASLEPGPALDRLFSSEATPSSPRGESPAEDARVTEPPAESAAGPRGSKRERTGEPRRKPSMVPEEELIAALRACRWDFTAAAEKLRISRTSLYALVESSPRIRKVAELSPEEIRRCHAECGGDVDAMGARLEVSKHALQRRMRELGIGG